MKRLLAGLITLIFLSVPAYANFDDAVDAHNRGDFKAEFENWKVMAEQGYDFAQYDLGAMYHDGIGVKQDYIQAYMWWNIAGANGYAKGYEQRDILRKKLSIDQINEAKMRSLEWALEHQWFSKLTADRNLDGKITISDVWLWIKWFYFYPGDFIVVLLDLEFPILAEFFEITENNSVGGMFSGIVSFFFWAILIFLSMALLFATIIGLAVSEKFQDIFWSGIGLLILYYFFPIFTGWVIFIGAIIFIIVRGMEQVAEQRAAFDKFEAERLAQGKPLEFHERRVTLKFLLVFLFCVFLIISVVAWLSSHS
jgi:hypothetical protein